MIDGELVPSFTLFSFDLRKNFIKFFNNFGHTYKDIFKILEDIGFKIYEFTEDRKISLVPDNYKPNETQTITDLLAIRDLPDFLERTNYSLQN